MTFDELLDASAVGGNVTVPSSWSQGRATFGGLTAALVFERMVSVVAEGRPMRSMQVSFVGPVKPEAPAKLSAEILREGKAVSQAMGRIEQDGQSQLVALASFGGGRESVVSVDHQPAPEAPAPVDCKPLPYIKDVTPEFTQHIEMRWAFGHMPFSGQGGREMGGWMQFREPPESITDAHIVALIDAWPPAILPHLKSHAPASSLSWALDILHPRPNIEPGDWLLYKATIDQAGAGYGILTPVSGPAAVNWWQQAVRLLPFSVDRQGLGVWRFRPPVRPCRRLRLSVRTPQANLPAGSGRPGV